MLLARRFKSVPRVSLLHSGNIGTRHLSKTRILLNQKASSVSLESLETCSGCGEKFHQDSTRAAGFLPDMEHRKRAFLMGLTFEHYKKHVLKKVSGSLSQYQQKRAQMDEVVSRSVSLAKDDIARSIGQLELQGLEIENKKVAAQAPRNNPTPEMNHQAPPSLVCARCHHLTFHKTLDLDPLARAKQLVHDVELENNELTQQRVRAILNDLPAKNAFVVALCDVFDFPGSLCLNELKKISTTRPVLVAINKCDLLPEGYNVERLAYYFKNALEQQGLEKLVGVHMVSVYSKLGMTDLLKSMIKYRSPADDVYVLGKVNVGKSSFMKFLLNEFDGPQHLRPTESAVPGTTINQISLPLKKLPKLRETVVQAKNELLSTKRKEKMKSINIHPSPSILPTRSSGLNKLMMGNIIDTPGLVNDASLTKFLTLKELSFIVPNKPIKPISFFLDPGRSLWVGGLGRVDYVEGKAQMIVTAFTSPKIPIHVSSMHKTEWLWNKHGGAKSIKWEEKLVINHQRITKPDTLLRVVRKNINKDLWSGAEMFPPFFSDPYQFLQSIRDGQEPPSGVLKDRVEAYPKFKLALETVLTNEKPLAAQAHSTLHFQQSIADVVFSGIGWLSFAGNFDKQQGRDARIQVYSPDGTGISLRQPALLPFEVMKRGRKVRNRALSFYKPADASTIAAAIRAEQSWWDIQKRKLKLQ